jgi:methionyl-tRNA formyltransferase
MSTVFFGTPGFAVPSLSALFSSGENISAVVTRPDRRRGRREKAGPSPVKEFALEHGLRVLQPESIRDEGFMAELGSIGHEFLVVVAYGKMLSMEILESPTVAPVNLHASLLPMYRGSAPIPWAIINGDRETGLTTQIISLAMDEGDILLTERHVIKDDDTAESLALRLSEAGGPLLVRTLNGLRDGTLKPVPQAGEPVYIPKMKKDDGWVDWSKPAREVYNFIRGMYPWPGAFCYINGERVRLIRARPAAGEGTPGRIMSVSGDGFYVGTGSGLVSVVELQPENRRPMTAKSFMTGRDVGEGTVIK